VAYDGKKTSRPSKTSEKLHLRKETEDEEEEEDPSYSPFEGDYDISEVILRYNNF